MLLAPPRKRAGVGKLDRWTAPRQQQPDLAPRFGGRQARPRHALRRRRRGANRHDDASIVGSALQRWRFLGHRHFYDEADLTNRGSRRTRRECRFEKLRGFVSDRDHDIGGEGICDLSSRSREGKTSEAAPSKWRNFMLNASPKPTGASIPRWRRRSERCRILQPRTRQANVLAVVARGGPC